MQYIIAYFAVINCLTVFLTCIDKYKAKHNQWRIPEHTLITFGILGGTLAEYITMRIIRHKTRHKKFMVGLPIIFVLQIIVLTVILYRLIIVP
ncbi:MAG: DUF1294 domain-containing protein [Clostridiales bacterium]|nr:DUF1294 domain-containing protein [Clostridiales bacterium]